MKVLLISILLVLIFTFQGQSENSLTKSDTVAFVHVFVTSPIKVHTRSSDYAQRRIDSRYK